MVFSHKRAIGIWCLVGCLATSIALLHGARQYVTGGHGHVPIVVPVIHSSDVRQPVTQRSEGSSNENIRSVSQSNGIAFLVGLTVCASCMASAIPAANALEVDRSKADTSQPLRNPWDKDKKPLEQWFSDRMPVKKSVLEKVTDRIAGNNRFPQFEKGLMEQAMSPVKEYFRNEESKNRVPLLTQRVRQMTGANRWEKTNPPDPAAESFRNLGVLGAGLVSTATVSFSNYNQSLREASAAKDKENK